MHYSLRPSRGNRLPLITVTGLNKLHTHGVTALHYGSCAPLSTLRLQPHDCNPKTRYQLPAKLYWAMDLHHGYTMYAELAHLGLDLSYSPISTISFIVTLPSYSAFPVMAP